jgi:polyphosphate kinase
MSAARTAEELSREDFARLQGEVIRLKEKEQEDKELMTGLQQKLNIQRIQVTQCTLNPNSRRRRLNSVCVVSRLRTTAPNGTGFGRN